jgi:hypothetical protein
MLAEKGYVANFITDYLRKISCRMEAFPLLPNDALALGQDTYWESIAQTRWGSYITEIEKRAILKSNNLSKKPSNALEIGCEGGRWSKLLSDLGWNMTCTDINSNIWRTRFCMNGFKMIYQEGICWLPFRRNSNSPFIFPCTQMERYMGLRRLPSLSPRVIFLAQKNIYT